jgi:hypothetical protein
MRLLRAPLYIVALLIALDIIAAACGDDGDNGAEGNDSTLEVTFDGTDCTYSGPEQVSENNINFRVANDSDTVLMLDIFRLDESKTFDDLAKHFDGEPGSAVPSSLAQAVKSIPVPATDATAFGMALTAGEYALVCVTSPQLRVQAVAPFRVVV